MATASRFAVALALACGGLACTFNHDDLGPRLRGSGGDTSGGTGGRLDSGGAGATNGTDAARDRAIDVPGSDGIGRIDGAGVATGGTGGFADAPTVDAPGADAADVPIIADESSETAHPTSIDAGTDAAIDVAIVLPVLDAQSEAASGACLIDSIRYGGDEARPGNPCQICAPTLSASSWTPARNGVACGPEEVCSNGICRIGCWIDDAFYQSAVTKPGNNCQYCNPILSVAAWTLETNGTSCGNGQTCSAGQCGSGCWIGATFYTSGTAQSGNPCQTCQPGTSISAWSQVPSGGTCGTGQVCNTGSCQAGCWIDAAFQASVSSKPGNQCQICQPISSVSTWTNAANGTSCGRGQVCSTGSCQAGCWIGSSYYASTTPNPNNPCQSCQPTLSLTEWSNVIDGTSCGTGTLCHGGACETGCMIAGVFYMPGAPDPKNACQTCQPTLSTSAWMTLPDGTDCAAGSLCHGGICRSQCRIESVFHDAGAANPNDPCQSCQPSQSKASWSNVPSNSCFVAAISAGSAHTCAVVNGAAKCWGYNSRGQLGNDSTASSSVPVQAQGLNAGLTAIGAGFYHTCAVVNGSVQCWGANDWGQLGNNSTTNSLIPVQVANLAPSATAVAEGFVHTCALAAGGVQCWGYNLDGELGNNSTTSSSVPVQVSGLTNGVTSISAGYGHTCAVVSGAAKCWGLNNYGQLGDGSMASSPVPVQVLGLTSGVTAISAAGSDTGSHTCAVVNGGIQCWGSNAGGELGNNSTISTSAPVQVTGLTTAVTAVAVGPYHVCALAGGVAWCWGYNHWGELGNNWTTNTLVPVQVTGLTSGATAISAGGLHTCALVGVSSIQCWGYNGSGQLGMSFTEYSLTPGQVPL